MPREAEPSLNEKQFVLSALKEGVRVDGREFDKFRSLELSFGDEYGVTDVTLGKTRIITKVSAEVVTPHSDRPFDGIFNIVTELSPMASPAFEASSTSGRRTTETEVLLSRLLEKTIRRSAALDTESLCLIAGQKVWSVRTDVHVLDHDGNLIDAACIGVVAALAHFRRPDTSIEGQTVTVYTLREREPVPLSLLHWPLCISFSFFTEARGDDDAKEPVLVDATLLEEQIRDGWVTVSLNRYGELCQIAKLGGVPIDAVTLLQCANVAALKVRELSDYIKLQLDADMKLKDKGGLMAELSAENDR